MIPDFKTYIGESLWGNIRDRVNGDDFRKELDMEGFKNYLEDHYELTDDVPKNTQMVSYNSIFTNVGINAFAVVNNGFSYFHLSLHDTGNGNYTLSINKTAQKLHIFDLLRKEFIMTDAKKGWSYILEPKEGKVDRKFFIEVLNFIMSHVEAPEINVVRKKI